MYITRQKLMVAIGIGNSATLKKFLATGDYIVCNKKNKIEKLNYPIETLKELVKEFKKEIIRKAVLKTPRGRGHKKTPK